MPRHRDPKKQNWGVGHQFKNDQPVDLIDVQLDDLLKGPLHCCLVNDPTDQAADTEYYARISFGNGGVNAELYCDFRHGVGLVVPGSYLRVIGVPDANKPKLAAFASLGAGINYRAPTWTVESSNVVAGNVKTFEWIDPLLPNRTVYIPPFAQAVTVYSSDAKTDQYTVIARSVLATKAISAFYSSNNNQGQEISNYPVRLPLSSDANRVLVRNDNPVTTTRYVAVFELGL